ncbi:hypothetical protein ABZX30_17410 [Streptomyces sp. NPDC004542]|uniref:hypothetical protein n=1 Tax=Streptomyces sp. NPDC004542 TaxID=3154281 RepID=UPI0033A8AE8B
MHRLLPPSAIAGVSVVCALGPWVFSEQTVLRSLAAVAAATAVAGAIVMRRWDIQAGKQVADLSRARASDEWRFEERVAELETDLEESREVRGKLEQRLRAKRAELTRLRNEHAALLRRYATAETERASALEGRRLLEIEAAEPSSPSSSSPSLSRALPAARAAEEDGAETGIGTEAGADASAELSADTRVPSGLFSPEGSRLFLRAGVALGRFRTGDEMPEAEAVAKGEGAREDVTEKALAPEAGPEDEAQGQPEAVDGHEHAAATTTTAPAEPGRSASQSTSQSTGHFAVPTAVAVVPAAPVRRPAVEGGFDFFGTQKDSPSGELDAVQNEDLADVVGQEALALHKAESEAHFKPAGAESRGVGQVIDLTAHDETEHIDLQGLRSAAS